MELNGAKIKKFRLDRGLSRKELGDEIGVGFSTISGWELDKWEPNPKAKALLKKIMDEWEAETYVPTNLREELRLQKIELRHYKKLCKQLQSIIDKLVEK